MANKNSVGKNATVALIKGRYYDIVEQSVKSLADGALVIDAADIFNDLTLSKYGITADSIDVFSPVTVFQLKNFVDEELREKLASGNVRTLIVAGLKSVFFDSNILDGEYLGMFRDMINNIKDVAAEYDVGVTMFAFDEKYANPRDELLDTALVAEADLVFELAGQELCIAC